MQDDESYSLTNRPIARGLRWRHPFDETERLHRNAGGDVMRRLIRRHPFDETSRVVALKC